MNTNGRFGAPWSKELKLATTVCLVVCIGVALIGIVSFPAAHPAARWNMILIPLLILIGGLLFMVRGYTIVQDELIIHRLGWSSRLDLGALASAAADPSAMTGSIRTAGNGGLFAFCGWFRNQKLGSYRAFGTDPRRSVVLRFPDRVVVVTPDAPERFVNEITKRQ
ncbi:MAG: hypothetical protein JWR26_4558 [Pedosphaera sp.]|nr:hypothetical protein [Pedosphaera sp.]